MRTLLLATTNRHKVEELQAMLADIPFQLVSLNDLSLGIEVEETGHTFQENAALKALEYARASNLLTLADDSGIEIDALGGAPGVYSARFAGEHTSYEERFRILFERLKGLSPEQRTARFRCVIALAEPSGFIQYAEGTIEGQITEEARGLHGFGYDPIFFVPDYGCTTAEMSATEKNRISHRGIAVVQARKLLTSWPTLSPEGR